MRARALAPAVGAALLLAGCVDPNQPVRPDPLLDQDNLAVEIGVANKDPGWARLRIFVLDGTTEEVRLNDTASIGPGETGGRTAFTPRNHSAVIEITVVDTGDGLYRAIPSDSCPGVLVWTLEIRDNALHNVDSGCEVE